MHKILIISAHSQEMSNIKSVIKRLNLPIEIDFLLIGVGNYETIFNLTRILEKNTYNFVLNIGICGYLTKKEELLQVGVIFNLSNKKELIVPICFEFTKLIPILTTDYYIDSIPELSGYDYVDMESYGIEFVLSKYNIPRILLKKPADKIGDIFSIDTIKKACNDLSTINYTDLLMQIISYLDSVPPKKDFDYIKKIFRLTFQEFEILKKKIIKYETLSGEDFEIFFEKNKNIEKKEFIYILDITINNFLINE